MRAIINSKYNAAIIPDI